MRKWLEKNPPPESSVAILDWRVASSLIKTLNSQNTPWILMIAAPLLMTISWLNSSGIFGSGHGIWSEPRERLAVLFLIATGSLLQIIQTYPSNQS